MRKAELACAMVLMLFAGYTLLAATALPVGWVPDEGPGGGAFPFWLSLVMLICGAGIVVQTVRQSRQPNPEGRAFIDRATLKDLAIVTGLLLATIALLSIIGTYLAIPLFLIIYLRGFSRMTWRLTAAFAVITPVVMFFFFEVTLKILLPKGFTEEWFIPLYAMFF